MTIVDERRIVEKIRNRYEEKSPEETKLEQLKKLDKKIKKPALVFGYTYGTISSLVLGTGMCLAMKVIGNLMALGIVIGLIGISMAITTYPIYKKILNTRKQKYSTEIILKSNELLNN